MSRHVTEDELMEAGFRKVLQTYSLQLIGPSDDYAQSKRRRKDWERIWATYFRETEENLTDLLPLGYSVSIQEWDAEEENPHE